MFDLIQHLLTLLTAPHKRASLASQAREILYNRQPEPLEIITESPLSDPSTSSLDLPSMNKFVQEPPRRSVHNGTKKDTGFPEPLSPDRNTTLPHPDADTSANASIEEPDISLTRTHSRRSFLSRHQSHKAPKHTHKDSGISVSGAGLYDSEKDTTSSPRAIESRVVGGATSLALEKELGSVHRSSESSEDDVVLLKDETDAQGYREGQRRKGVLRKLHLHKI